jgi:hypothetical protein
MSFNYQNPLVGSTVTGPDSPTSLDRDYGTNFSVYNIGGYKEVPYLSDLNYSFTGTGNIFLSANTIPIKFFKSSNVLTDKVFLWNDGISSGRRRVGMLVYVQENDTTYQYQIDNYETLWDSAENAGCLVYDGETFWEIRNKVGATPNVAGQAFMDAWTGSTIEGVNGVTREEARWRIFYGTDVQITGGTYNSGTTTLDLFNSTGGTVSITGVTTGGGGSGSSTEYLSINAVPSSYGILAWDNLQPFRDTYVTIPKDFNGRTITSVTASYGDSASTTNAVFELQMKNSNNSVASSVSWTHTGDNRSYQEIFGSGLTLASGNTLNLFYSSTPPDGNAKGYSATFEISN